MSDAAYRAIWAECYELWLECRAGSSMGVRARIGGVDFHRPIEEYLADVIVLAHRKLTLYELIVFTRAYIWQWNPHRCCHSLGVDRVRLYQQLQTIQTKLGRTFAENGMRPIEYFWSARMRPPVVLDLPRRCA